MSPDSPEEEALLTAMQCLVSFAANSSSWAERLIACFHATGWAAPSGMNPSPPRTLIWLPR